MLTTNALLHITFYLFTFLNFTSGIPAASPNPSPTPIPNPSEPEPYTEPCSFSCPLQDNKQQKLLSSPQAIGYDSDYSIFECIYLINTTPLSGKTHKCSYYKDSGAQALSSVADDCPSQAPPCISVDAESNSDIESLPPPRFSHLKYEAPSWVEFNRYGLYLMHNPIVHA